MADIYLQHFIPSGGTGSGGGTVDFNTPLTADYSQAQGAVKLTFSTPQGGSCNVQYFAINKDDTRETLLSTVDNSVAGLVTLFIYNYRPFTTYTFGVKAVIDGVEYLNPQTVTYTTPSLRTFKHPYFAGLAISRSFVKTGSAYIAFDEATGGSGDIAYNVYVDNFKAPPSSNTEVVELDGRKYVLVKDLKNGQRYDFLMRAYDKTLRYEDDNINTFSALVQDTRVSMPASYNDLAGINGYDGFMESLVVTLNTPIGYVLGKVPPKDGVFENPIWTLSDPANFVEITQDGTMQLKAAPPSAGNKVITVTCDSGGLVLTRQYVVKVINNADRNTIFFSNFGAFSSLGSDPHNPTSDISSHMNSENKTYLFERGCHIQQALGFKVFRQGCVIGAYGDPSKPRPILQSAHTHCMTPAVDDTRYKICAAVIKDLDLRGEWRSGYLPYAHDVVWLRCMLGHNIDHPNSSGIHLGWTFGCKVMYCEAEGCHGDAVYGHTCLPSKGIKVINHNTGEQMYVGVNDYTEIGYGRFGVPAGKGADNIQFSHEGQESRKSWDIWVHHVSCYQNLTGTSLKGAFAVEGVKRMLVENSYFQGKYFGFAISGDNCTARNNVVEDTGLPDGHPDQDYSNCIGTGDDSTSMDMDMYDNEINRGRNGIGISSYGDDGGTADTPSGYFERPDWYLAYNIVTDCTRSHRINRPWSGELTRNIFQNTPTGYVNSLGTTVSTLGDIHTQVVDFNISVPVKFDQILPNPTLSGTVAVGKSLQVIIPPEYTGVDMNFQWRLNGRPIAGATESLLWLTEAHKNTINENLPASMQAAEISCIVLVTDKVTGAKYYMKAHRGETPYVVLK